MNFERGQDPKEALNLGVPEFRLIVKIEVLAKKFGLVKTDKNTLAKKDPEFRDIAQWTNPKNKKQGILFFQYMGPEYINDPSDPVYKSTEKDYFIMVFAGNERRDDIQKEATEIFKSGISIF